MQSACLDRGRPTVNPAKGETTMRPLRYTLFVAISLALFCALLLPLRFEPPGVTAQVQESVISFPPDLTPYTRPAIPEDLKPIVTATPTPTPPPPPGIRQEQARLSPSSLATAPIFIRDVVVSNTNTTLTNTDMSG